MDIDRRAPADPHLRVINVALEPPRGSRNHDVGNPATDALAVSRILPAGMTRRCEVGLIPPTTAPAGSPLGMIVRLDAAHRSW